MLSAYSYTPNDPDLPQQWAMYRLGLLKMSTDMQAWSLRRRTAC